MKSLRIRLCLATVLALFTLPLISAEPGADAPPRAWLADIGDAIGPATTDHVIRALDDAARAGARVFVLRMDTPGGLDSSMRSLIRAILESPVPVVTWVAPAGSRAASAGTYILYASHVAAMAPSTHLGAATPVTMGGMPGQEEPAGEQPESDVDEEGKRRGGTAMERKMLEDAVSYIRSLAERHRRNADWAEEAVREAVTLTAEEALARNVIDVVASDVHELLAQVHGRTVRMGNDATLTLDTRDLDVHEVEPDWRTELLAVITNPNVAYFLMLIGFYGLVFELASPGQIYPGVIGAICLVLALYAFQVLPVSYAGVALILLGLAFMTAEAFAPSFGILGLGGIVAFAIGSVILVDDPALAVAWPLIAGMAAVSAALMIWMLGTLIAFRRRPALAGREEMLERTAVALEDFDREGWVRVRGESWRATTSTPVLAGQRLRVVASSGLMLTVAPLDDTSAGAPPTH